MKKIFVSLIATTVLFAESDYNLIFDPYFSPYMGADNLLATHELIEKTKLGKLNELYSNPTSFLARASRAGELALFWDPTNYFSMVAQHEVFGHGYRVRSTEGASVVKYQFGVPIPYGPGGGATSYQFNPYTTTVFQNIAIGIGGVESTAIYSNRTRLNWLAQGNINPRQSTLYLFSQHDLTNYISASGNRDGDDIADYIRQMNQIYAKSDLSLSTLQLNSLINYLDPFTYYSFWSWGEYVMSGKSLPIPMIKIGSYGYLPSTRLGLTPFGPEYYLENFLVKDNKPIYFYLRGSNFAGMTSLGAGIEYPNMTTLFSLPIGFRLDLWHQPNIDYINSPYVYADTHDGRRLNLTIKDSQVGLSASLIVEKKLWSTGALFVQCGAKTKGFVPGESLEASPIVRVGITLW